MKRASVFALLLISGNVSAAEWPYEGYGADLARCEVDQGGTFEYDSWVRKWTCNPESRKKCESQGGMWVALGRRGLGSCARIATDGGKPCTDSSQCELGCTYRGGPRQADGSVVGVCASLDREAGCRTNVQNGKVASAVCVD